MDFFLSPRFASCLHVIGERDVVRPHVKLPLPEAQHAAVHTPAVNAHAHVNVDPCHLAHQPAHTPTPASSLQPCRKTSTPPERFSALFFNLRDGLNHVNAHLHAAVGVVSPGLGQPRHTVVTIAQNFDPETVILLRIRGYRRCLL